MSRRRQPPYETFPVKLPVFLDPWILSVPSVAHTSHSSPCHYLTEVEEKYGIILSRSEREYAEKTPL